MMGPNYKRHPSPPLNLLISFSANVPAAAQIQHQPLGRAYKDDQKRGAEGKVNQWAEVG